MSDRELRISDRLNWWSLDLYRYSNYELKIELNSHHNSHKTVLNKEQVQQLIEFLEIHYSDLVGISQPAPRADSTGTKGE